ncbi:hypothetical protein QQX09_10995 [Demequina sp. SYSU T00192]|uniref:Uncharacterized protein n=1 Tax=Demequina litoralis TaxID=3051660 RepID=A0ABT8GBE8_9MICO|nr:hypothetical protein [Demequina sp. SYSU T00192]MDN4476382.1 hypothetical protein [Demequina sp. SYSU T00192]
MKLSDALRGAADRAPLDGLAIDTRRAQRRVTTQRGLRTGSGGVLAGGMVVVLGFGISGAVSGSSASSGDDATRDEAAAVTEDSAGGFAGEADGGEMAGSSALAWGLCGQELPFLDSTGAPVELEATVTGEPAVGEELAVTATTTVVTGGSFETFGLDGVVLWDGIVVGTLGSGDVDGVSLVDLVEGSTTSEDLGVPLENCWDGEPLPASKYELVLTQEYYATAVDEPPVVEPAEPTDPATDPATPEAVDSEEPGGGEAVDGEAGATGGDDAVVDDEAGSSVGSDATDMPGSVVAAGGPALRAIAPPVGFVVAGDAVDEPFAAYLRVDEPEPVPTTPANEDALDAATARMLYRDALAGPWDMAAGTQRWIVSGDSTGALPSTWFGCAWDGDGGFPARSAAMDLLDVAVDAPATIDVSYGWIVDGNPALTSRVANASAWDLDSFWDARSVQLALVRDGRVVAEAYPVSPYQHGDVAIAEPAIGADGAEDATIAIEPYGYSEGGLARGESVESTLLWRDVNGCWSDSGQTAVDPGTYTLLAMHYLSVGGGDLVYMDGSDEALLEEQSARDADLGGTLGSDDEPLLVEPDSTDAGEATIGGGATGSAIAPAPDVFEVYDAVDFQVWTSLGTVTVR